MACRKSGSVGRGWPKLILCWFSLLALAGAQQQNKCATPWMIYGLGHCVEDGKSVWFASSLRDCLQRCKQTRFSHAPCAFASFLDDNVLQRTGVMGQCRLFPRCNLAGQTDHEARDFRELDSFPITFFANNHGSGQRHFNSTAAPYGCWKQDSQQQ